MALKESAKSHMPPANMPILMLLVALICISVILPLSVYFYLTDINVTKAALSVHVNFILVEINRISPPQNASFDEVITEVKQQLKYVFDNYTLTYYLLDTNDQIEYFDSSNLNGENLFPLDKAIALQMKNADGGPYFLSDAYRGRLCYMISDMESEWTLVCIFPTSQFVQSNDELARILAISLAIMSGLLLLSFFIVRKFVIVPTRCLMHTMRNPSLPSLIDDYAIWKNEIGQLCTTYLTRASDYKESLLQIKKLSNERRESEIEVLQNQINSHFIYNTLNNIQWLASANRMDDVVKTVKSLDMLFRAWMLADRDFVTIEEELGYVEAYLIVQKIRFNDVFDYVFDIDFMQMQMKIPRFVLQPIVENCIYHGFLDPKLNDGHIKISLLRRGFKIIIEIYDNGIGIEKERILDILSNMQKSSGRYMGVAIGNINKRIQLLCGREYGVSIQSKFNNFTKISITIPVIS